MKYYISADIEGVAGSLVWSETERGHEDYDIFAQQMTSEVKALCEGILAVDRDGEILVHDAHDTGRNIDHAQLPNGVRLIRGWMGHPLQMIEGIDESYDAILFVGYHQGAGLGGNYLAHTMSTDFTEISLNGRKISEYDIHRLAGEMLGVPTALLSGDEALCTMARERDSNLITISTKKGIGRSAVCRHPQDILNDLHHGGMEVAKRLPITIPKPLQGPYELVVKFNDLKHAHRASFYPQAEKIDDYTISLVANEYFDVLRAMLFFGG